MAIRPTASTQQLIRDGIRLVQDIHDASNGKLSDECCASIAAGILARDTHGEKLYQTVDDAPRPGQGGRR